MDVLFPLLLLIPAFVLVGWKLLHHSYVETVLFLLLNFICAFFVEEYLYLTFILCCALMIVWLYPSKNKSDNVEVLYGLYSFFMILLVFLFVLDEGGFSSFVYWISKILAVVFLVVCSIPIVKEIKNSGENERKKTKGSAFSAWGDGMAWESEWSVKTQRKYAARILGTYLSQNKDSLASDIRRVVKKMVGRNSYVWGNEKAIMKELVNVGCPDQLFFCGKMKEVLSNALMTLSLCEMEMEIKDESLYSLLKRMKLNPKEMASLDEELCRLQRVKAAILLLKNVAAISGGETDAEREEIEFYVTHLVDDGKRYANPIHEYMMESYKNKKRYDLNRVAYQALDYLALFDRVELNSLIIALFDVANVEDGIVCGELEFLCQCCIYAGLTEMEFRNVCHNYQVEFYGCYQAQTCDGFPKGRDAFEKEYLDCWGLPLDHLSGKGEASFGRNSSEDTNKQRQWEEKRSSRKAKQEERKRQEQKRREEEKCRQEKKKQRKQGRREQTSEDEQRRRREQWEERRNNRTPSSLDSYYEILHISQDVPFEEVKRTYRKMVMKCHPDRLGSDATPEEIKKANERLIEINDAYKILCEVFR